jgi:hypothetical protein
MIRGFVFNVKRLFFPGKIRILSQFFGMLRNTAFLTEILV